MGHKHRGHRITEWNPEDTAAWETGDKQIARRNLLCTMAGDHVAFSIWSLWSVMALFRRRSRTLARIFAPRVFPHMGGILLA